MTYTCTGITHCEYLHPQLQEMHHIKLSDSDWMKIIQLRKQNTTESIQKQANRYKYIPNVFIMY